VADRIKTVDAETLLSTPLKKTLFVVEGLIPQGVTLLCGAGKIGKSWLMLWLGLRVSQGLPVWELETQRCDVLYLCLEDTFARVQNRLYQLKEEATENLRFAVMSGRIGEGLEKQLTDYLLKYPNTKLVIIDTLQKVRRTDGTDGRNGMYGSDYNDISALKQIADQFGIAVVLVHHLRKLKDSRDPFNQVSGTTGITGAVDTTLVLNKDERSANTAVLLATGRDIEYQQMRLQFDGTIWQLIERKNSEELRNEEVPTFLFELVNFLSSRNEWTGTATELLSQMGNCETSASAVTRLLSHFYYDVLQPAGIKYQTKRTGTSRLIRLKRDDDSDANDRNFSIAENPSQPSQASQHKIMEE